MIRVKAAYQEPAIMLTYPVGGETVYRDLTATATATDEDGDVERVYFYYKDTGGTYFIDYDDYDGDNFYSATLDTLQIAEGDYKILASAVDDTGHQSTDTSDWLTVDNTIEPTVEVIYPNGGEQIACWDYAEADASDTDGYVDYVEFFLTGCINKYLGADYNGADGWKIQWNSNDYIVDSSICLVDARAVDDTDLDASDFSDAYGISGLLKLTSDPKGYPMI